MLFGIWLNIFSSIILFESNPEVSLVKIIRSFIFSCGVLVILFLLLSSLIFGIIIFENSFSLSLKSSLVFITYIFLSFHNSIKFVYWFIIFIFIKLSIIFNKSFNWFDD